MNGATEEEMIVARLLPGCRSSRYHLVDVNTWDHIWKAALTLLEILDQTGEVERKIETVDVVTEHHSAALSGCYDDEGKSADGK